MKSRWYLIIALLGSVNSIVSAQSFTLSTSPRSQSLVGATASYSVTATPQSGFSATVFVKAYAPTLPQATIGVSGNINAPYSETSTISVTLTGPKEGGTHSIIIEGKNGPVVVHDTVWLEVPSRKAWRVFNNQNSPLPSNTITAVAVDRDGVGWIGTDVGLARFDGNNWTVFDSSTCPLIGSNRPPKSNGIVAIAVDSSNGVWVRNAFGELARFSEGSWMKFDVQLAKPGGIYTWLEYRASIAAGTKSVWVASDERLLEFKGTTMTTYTQATSTEMISTPRALAVDRIGVLWIANDRNMVAKYDGTFWSLYGSHYISNFSVWSGPQGWSLAVDMQNFVWAGALGQIAKIDGSQTAYEGRFDGRFPGPNPMWIDFDAVGTMWIGMWSEGMGRYDGTNWWNYTIANSGLPANDITTLVAAHDRSIWIGTNSGLAILDGTAPPNSTISDVGSGGTDNEQLHLSDIYPNPVTGRSSVMLSLPERGHVQLGIINTMGQQVAVLLDGTLELGEQLVPFNSDGLPTGTYFLRLATAGTVEVKPIVVAR